MGLLSLLVILAIASVAIAQCPWNDGSAVYWSNAATWAPNPVPFAGSNVVLPSGKKVIYDVTASGLTFAGVTIPSGSELIFDGTKDVRMETNFINVNNGSAFRIGSASCHYPTKATILLFGAYDTTTNVVPFMGTKNVIVQGLLEWYGNPPQPTWTTVTATVNVNDNTITVKDYLVNWKVGDRIALASTDYYQDLTEPFTIAAISGKTITLSDKAKYLHWGDNNEFAEVGHITRNIVVQGDPSSDASSFGGHCIVIGNGIAHVYGVEFTKMGQKGVLARYPFHFHYMGNQIGRGHFVSECSFHDNYQRCLTVHATSGVLVQNNVGFNVTGHCYFLEEGSETYNTYDHNLGMVVNPGPMIHSDLKPAIFWITNPNNTFTNNVAVGGEFGYWFSLPFHPIGMSKGQTNVYPRYTPLLRFDNNLAHSADDSGIFFDNGPDENGNTDEESSYSPLVPPYTSETQPYNTPTVRSVMSGNNAYKNRQHGIWARGSSFTFKNSLLIDNGVGVNMPATANIFRDSTIVGETPNIGTPGHTMWFNDFGRSRPILWWPNFPIHGFEGYDSTGGQFCSNVTFVNFTTDSVRRAGAIGVITDGIFILPPNDMVSMITLINSNAFAMPDDAYNDPTYASYLFDGPNHVILHDTDGSLTGVYGNCVTSNRSILQDGGCVPVPAWNNFYNCSKNVDGYSQLTVTNLNIPATDFGNSLTMTYRAIFIPFGKPAVQDSVTGGDPRDTIRTEYTSNLISRHGYFLKFPHNTPPQLQVTLRFAASGEWVVVALAYPATTFIITRGYGNVLLTPAASLATLSKSTYYYDATNEYLYVMYFEDDGGLVNPTGFPEYGYGASYINILAGCGNTCAVGSHAVPATYPDNEDKYQVTLKGCGASTTSSKEGVGYIRFNKNTHVVTYLIYHNIPTATTAAIYVDGNLFQTLPVGQSPIRGAFEISWKKWNSLWNGNWKVVVRSQQYPSAEIAGIIGCVGTCTAPSKISSADPCAVIAKQNVLYGDTLNSSIGWSDWSWNTVRNYSYTADKRCGAAAMQVFYNTWGGVVLHMGIGDCNPGQCTQSWQIPYLSVATYSYFQFNVRSPSGPIPTPLVISAQDSTGANIGSVVVSFNYIDNFIVEETWTRVKVPLSAIGFKGNELIGLFIIQLQAELYNLPMILDDIKLVPTYSDPITTSPVGAVYKYVVGC